MTFYLFVCKKSDDADRSALIHRCTT